MIRPYSILIRILTKFMETLFLTTFCPYMRHKTTAQWNNRLLLVTKTTGDFAGRAPFPELVFISVTRLPRALFTPVEPRAAVFRTTNLPARHLLRATIVQ